MDCYIVESVECFFNLYSKGANKLEPSKLRYYDLTYVIKGSLNYIIDGERVVLEENDAIFLKPGTLRAREATDTPVKYVSFNFTILGDRDLPFEPVMRKVVTNDIIKLTHIFPKSRLICYDHSKEKIANILNYILFELIDVYSYKTSNEYIIRAIQYIEEHITENISLSGVAEHLNLSKEYTASLFKKETGETVTFYIQERKMQLAKEKMQTTNAPLSKIAADLGYDNYSYFSRIFKKHFNISPQKYSRRME